MSFLKGFLRPKPEPKRETEIRMGFWKVHENEVLKEIEYVGYSPVRTLMRIEITCQWSSLKMPLVFLNIRFAAPGLAATPGYLTTRWQTKTLDSGFCVVRLDHSPDKSTIINVMGNEEVGEILKVLTSGKPMDVWFGGEGGDLLRLPVPPEDGLEALIEQAAKHPAAHA